MAAFVPPRSRPAPRRVAAAKAAPDAALQRLVRRLQTRGRTVATAESCTGGGLARALTDPPGASHWFLAGWVVYSNDAKQRDLGVKAATLARYGAVSEPTVHEMAAQALRRSGADLAVAISGIAGPGGAVPGKPLGMVWFGFAARDGRGARVGTVVKRFRGDRAAVREAAVRFAIRRLYSMA
jgi:nicotinamide-nucleotide amidase